MRMNSLELRWKILEYYTTKESDRFCWRNLTSGREIHLILVSGGRLFEIMEPRNWLCSCINCCVSSFEEWCCSIAMLGCSGLDTVSVVCTLLFVSLAVAWSLGNQTLGSLVCAADWPTSGLSSRCRAVACGHGILCWSTVQACHSSCFNVACWSESPG